MKVLRRSGLPALVFCLIFGPFLFEAPAEARGFVRGISDGLLIDPDPGTRNTWLNRARDARAGVVRLDVHWSDLTRTRPKHPSDPEDPAYDFTSLDQGVIGAKVRGMEVLLTVFHAPSWAEGPGRPAWAPVGSWKPAPKAFGEFVTALARRYSGNHRGLPRVRQFEAWNEPNLSDYLTPQRIGRKVTSPGLYRRLANSMYRAVHRVHRDNVVVVGATGPYGDPSGRKRIRPVEFLRRLFCLKDRKRLRRDRCRARVHLDVLSHHPINTSGGPDRSALSPDDASTPDLGRVIRVLRAAERRKTVLPNGRRQVWVTEFWWKSNPPDLRDGVSPIRQARRIEEALHSFWAQGARVAIYFLISDRPYIKGGGPSFAGIGLYYANGRPKPGFRAFRFPFVVRRLGRRTITVWMIPPRAGTMRIEVKQGRRWRTVAVRKVRSGRVLQIRFRQASVARARALRARVGQARSVVWPLR